MIRILQRIGWLFVDNWKVIVPIIAVLVIVIGLWSYCGKRNAPKLNEAEIQKGEAAKKAANDEELRKILTNSDVREKAIDANVANSEANKVNAIAESKQKWDAANRADLQAEFDRRANQ